MNLFKLSGSSPLCSLYLVSVAITVWLLIPSFRAHNREDWFSIQLNPSPSLDLTLILILTLNLALSFARKETEGYKSKSYFVYPVLRNSLKSNLFLPRGRKSPSSKVCGYFPTAWRRPSRSRYVQILTFVSQHAQLIAPRTNIIKSTVK